MELTFYFSESKERVILSFYRNKGMIFFYSLPRVIVIFFSRVSTFLSFLMCLVLWALPSLRPDLTFLVLVFLTMMKGSSSLKSTSIYLIYISYSIGSFFNFYYSYTYISSCFLSVFSGILLCLF
jgi:hypothetical protein